MKKACLILFIGVFLALMVSLPVVADTEVAEKSKLKFSLSVAGMASIITQGYDYAFDFDARAEEATWTEAVANVGSKFGFDIGASIFPISQLEIYASYSTYGGQALGNYTLSLPHWVYFDSNLTSSIADVESEFKATVINIGLAFHPQMSGKIKPYFGVGASSVTVKMDLLDEVSLDDHLFETDYFAWWDYYDYSYWTEYDETMDLTGIGFTEASETVWGFHAKAGVNLELAKNISIFVEGRYLSATVEFERPDSIMFKSDTTSTYTYDYWDYYYDEGYTDEYTETWEQEDEIDVDDTIEVKVGGIRGIIGIKFTF